MRLFGLIGYPLSHSFSKTYFTEKFSREKIQDARYENFSIEKIETLPELITAQPDLRGLNVTIPYKTSVLNYLDETDEVAAHIGAVNTIKISSGKLKGFNTDYIGFSRSLIPLIQPVHQRALILGTGGASLAVKFALEKLDIGFTFVSRNPKNENTIRYSDLTADILSEHLLIINTTPIGMYPNVEQAPEIPYHRLTGKHLLYDLIYNPELTLFLKKGKEKKAQTKNGYDMLVSQAEESWKIWNGF